MYHALYTVLVILIAMCISASLQVYLNTRVATPVNVFENGRVGGHRSATRAFESTLRAWWGNISEQSNIDCYTGSASGLYHGIEALELITQQALRERRQSNA